MSYKTWHDYGFGVCTDEIPESDVGRLQSLLVLAPEFRAKVEGWLAEEGLTDPTWEDYMDYDQNYYLGITGFFQISLLVSCHHFSLISVIFWGRN